MTETTPFHVGSYELHPDRSLNFQLNRWIAYRPDTLLPDIQSVLARLTSYDAWIEEFLALSDRAMAEGRRLDAAYHLRSAEFFMKPSDPRKRGCRARFVATLREAHGVTGANVDSAPFGETRLPIYRFEPSRPRGTIVLFGGFDSYIEEFLPLLPFLRDRGFDVVAFEGPGQGAPLEEAGVPMTRDWHLPLGAVLDHLDLSRVTLVGISLGGCLAIRAAARESRVKRVVAFDVLADFGDSLLAQLPPESRYAVRWLLAARAGALLDRLAKRAARSRPVVDWGLSQAMHVFGARTPHEALSQAMQYRTDDVSPLVRQDVLLLAGAEDHYVPLHQLYEQARSLTGARSVTTRLFTRAESAQSHCQIGNLGLALESIVDWIGAVDTSGPRASGPVARASVHSSVG